MKKPYNYITIFIIGLFVGATIVGIMLSVILPKQYQVGLLSEISKLENMTLSVYRVGDFNSSIVALNQLATELEQYQKIIKIDTDVHDRIATDLGLTHARLFMVYNKAGKQELANQQYQKAIQLIGNKLNISSQEELKEAIEKIDKSARNSR